MRIVITGSGGQLGRALSEELAGRHEVLGLTHQECDVAEPRAIGQIAALEPELVIHAAALTDVDGCARDPERAFRVNALGTRHAALACQRSGASLLYVSTNEVFDGTKTLPYGEFDRPAPINPYGASKLAGEREVRSLLHAYYIVRTSWLFGPGGHHFVRKVLALAAGHPELSMVTEEVGSPTYTPDLARALAALVATGVYGRYHLTNAGSCSRYDYARRILDLSGRRAYPLRPITLDEYQRASTPPRFSALDNLCAASLGITLRPWEEALEEYLRRYPAG